MNAPGDRIYGPNYRGWTRDGDTIDGYRRVRLKRVSDTAVEGRFTCRISGDSDSPRGLVILHPSESDMKVVVVHNKELKFILWSAESLLAILYSALHCGRKIII